ncbi:hypothetical protein [Azospirillum sp. B2RO_4]|uniref:hypothetical protein n=1 Tax=Azospirillum sp. B2RO_4 TaxID=3027796 RepID=UPI003DA80E3C
MVKPIDVCRSFTRSHSAVSMMRNSGTSTTSQASGGLGRATEPRRVPGGHLA